MWFTEPTSKHTPSCHSWEYTSIQICSLRLLKCRQTKRNWQYFPCEQYHLAPSNKCPGRVHQIKGMSENGATGFTEAPSHFSIAFSEQYPTVYWITHAFASVTLHWRLFYTSIIFQVKKCFKCLSRDWFCFALNLRVTCSFWHSSAERGSHQLWDSSDFVIQSVELYSVFFKKMHFRPLPIEHTSSCPRNQSCLSHF